MMMAASQCRPDRPSAPSSFALDPSLITHVSYGGFFVPGRTLNLCPGRALVRDAREGQSGPMLRTKRRFGPR